MSTCSIIAYAQQHEHFPLIGLTGVSSSITKPELVEVTLKFFMTGPLKHKQEQDYILFMKFKPIAVSKKQPPPCPYFYPCITLYNSAMKR